MFGVGGTILRSYIWHISIVGDGGEIVLQNSIAEGNFCVETANLFVSFGESQVRSISCVNNGMGRPLNQTNHVVLVKTKVVFGVVFYSVS